MTREDEARAAGILEWLDDAAKNSWNIGTGLKLREAHTVIKSLLASRVSTPPSDEEVEALIARLTELVDDAIQENEYVQSERSDLGPAEDWEEERVAMRAVRDDVIAVLRRQAVSTPEPVRHISDKRASGMEPTDEDEREALATILATWRDDSPEEWAIDMYRDAADAILAAGFRRQAVSTPEWEYGIRMVGTSTWASTTPDHVAKVQTWHNGTYEFARRTAPGLWEPVPTEGEA